MTSQPLTTEATIMMLRGDEFLSNAEIEEMESAIAGVPDEDWAWYFEATYVDPAEQDGPCCGDRLCPCGGYIGGNHGPAPYWS